MGIEAIVGEAREVQNQLKEGYAAAYTGMIAASHILDVATQAAHLLGQAHELMRQLDDDPAARVLMGIGVSEPLYDDAAQRLTDLEGSSANRWLIKAAEEARAAHAHVASDDVRSTRTLPELVGTLLTSIEAAKQVIPAIKSASYNASGELLDAGRNGNTSSQYLEYYIGDLLRPAA